MIIRLCQKVSRAELRESIGNLKIESKEINPKSSPVHRYQRILLRYKMRSSSLDTLKAFWSDHSVPVFHSTAAKRKQTEKESRAELISSYLCKQIMLALLLSIHKVCVTCNWSPQQSFSKNHTLTLSSTPQDVVPAYYLSVVGQLDWPIKTHNSLELTNHVTHTWPEENFAKTYTCTCQPWHCMTTLIDFATHRKMYSQITRLSCL